MRTPVPPRVKTFARHKALVAPGRKPALRKIPVMSATPILFLTAFLLGYLPGIAAGRNGESVLGQQLAVYYTEQSHFSVWQELFASQMAATFLQLLFVLLCGFSAFGTIALFLFFSGKGLFLGFCAANVLALQGSRALGVYWGSTCLPDLVFLFVAIWLSTYATAVSRGLFQSAFCGGAPRGQLAGNARKLVFHFGVALLLSAIFRAFCSGVVIFFFRLFCS